MQTRDQLAHLTHRPGEDQVFTGIDEVDWASLHHAHGSAGDVPELLRALASGRAAVRESALDALYGSVHHRGAVYDSTLAAVPFLLALAAEEGVADRAGLVELLVSIGGETDAAGALGPSGEAGVPPGEAAVRAGAEVFAALTTDPDPDVRRVAVDATVRFLDDPARVLPLLSRRLLFERDDDALVAVTESVGLFVRRHPAHASEGIALLTTHLPSPDPPVLRLAVLGQLAAHAPDRLPPDLVPLTARLLAERSARRTRACASPGAEETLTGRLHRLRPSDEQGARLLRTLHTALGDDVPTRTALLLAQLRLPSPVDRCNAVLLSAALIREWRGDHTALVSLIGEQLASGEGRLRDAAVSVLGGLFGVAGPAADRLYGVVAGRPEGWVERWRAGIGGSAGLAAGSEEAGGSDEPGGAVGSEGSAVLGPGAAAGVGPAGTGGRFAGSVVLGGALLALARCGDARAVGVLGEVLDDGELPRHAASVVPWLGAAAGPLVPALRRRLRAVPLDRPEAAEVVRPLLVALGSLRDGSAVPEVLRIVGGGPAGLVETAFGALEAMGDAAREALPVVREALGGAHRGAAAAALWAIAPDASFVLPALLAELTESDAHHDAEPHHDARPDHGTGPHHRARTADRLSRLGPEAHPALPALRRLLTDSDSGSGSGSGSDADSRDPWERVSAACAIASITGETERDVRALLRSAWETHPHTRVHIATTLTHLPASAAAPLLDLPATELARIRRHISETGGQGIVRDEELLKLCRRLVTTR
ncbi:HEAT repeat domain-containing protein [Streptomyces sp. NPDC004539]|uniref:HEAT repeat domain-containing protein n=1 Tax=Streptomyces sp. NPDC004539 TaxID=3154280 RepID=UPI0033B81A36